MKVLFVKKLDPLYDFSLEEQKKIYESLSEKNKERYNKAPSEVELYSNFKKNFSRKIRGMSILKICSHCHSKEKILFLQLATTSAQSLSEIKCRPRENEMNKEPGKVLKIFKKILNRR